MGGSGVIDSFLGVFTRYIDSGFGLLGGEVGFIASTLIVIDVTLADLLAYLCFTIPGDAFIPGPVPTGGESDGHAPAGGTAS